MEDLTYQDERCLKNLKRAIEDMEEGDMIDILDEYLDQKDDIYFCSSVHDSTDK
jgi:hypothetical protein